MSDDDWFDEIYEELTGEKWQENVNVQFNPPLKEEQKKDGKRKQKTPRKGVQRKL